MRLIGTRAAALGLFGVVLVASAGTPTASGHRVATSTARPRARSSRLSLTATPLASQPLSRVAAATIGNAPRAHLLGPAAVAAPVTVTLSFKPSDPKLLSALAANANGRSHMPISELRRLVAPPAALVRETTAYLHGYGFRLAKRGILTASYRGSIGAAQHAFHTTLSRYQRGLVSFVSPLASPRLPAGIARHVQLVSGLDTYPRYHPLTALTPCTGADNAQTTYSAGLTAQQLASATGYDAQPLITAGYDGSGEVIDFVEYATYNASDITAFESCYGAGMSGPVSQIAVGGGTTRTNGLGEVELDDESALSLAPGLDHIYNYAAGGGTSQGEVIDQMLSDAAVTHVTAISTSWGMCEPLAFNAEIASTHVELELAAVAGIPVMAASGDDGSEDCAQSGISDQVVDYPAADPYMTAVGGTTLNISTVGANHETAWGTPATVSGGGGGGGVSMYYLMPTWQQSATGAIEGGYSSASKCGSTSTYCREVPDVSLDSNPDTGSLIDCTTHCDTGISGWQPVGGTSEAAPMLAALIADANGYSLANGGGRVGFANAFFYANQGTGIFNDITVGTNGTASYSGYPAGAGYDMATGLGSIDANLMAQQLATYTDGTSYTFQTTALTGNESHKAITYPGGVTLSGTLTNVTGGGFAIGGRPVYVEGFFTYHGTVYAFQKHLITDAFGHWSTTASAKNVGSKMVWEAVYPGEEGQTSAASTVRTLRFIPELALGAQGLSWSGSKHAYITRVTRLFNVLGAAGPNMRGFHVSLQERTGRRWVTTTVRATIGRKSRWYKRISLNRAGTVYLRWHYKGSKSGEYLSSNSKAVKFIVLS